jgi:hypothetical protein
MGLAAVRNDGGARLRRSASALFFDSQFQFNFGYLVQGRMVIG